MSRNFDVLYIGWSEAKGIWGDEFVIPVFEHICTSRESQSEFVPEKLRLSVKSMEIQVMKEIFSTNQVRTFVEYPNIPLIDVSYVMKLTHKEQIYVSFLVLGYDPYTGFPVHLYVYQVKNDDDAMRLISLILRKTSTSELKKRFIEIEDMLVEDRKIKRSNLRNVMNDFKFSSIKRTNSKKLSQSSSSEEKFIKNDSIRGDSKEEMVKELQSKLNSRQCILLPPRDYDTIHRKTRNLSAEFKRYNLPMEHLPFSKMN